MNPNGIIPAAVDLIVRRASPLVRTFHFTDGDNNPIDLTAWFPRFAVRTLPNTSGSPLLYLDQYGGTSLTGSTLVNGGPNGTVALNLTAAEIQNFPGADSPFSTGLSYDLYLTDPDGSFPYVSGSLIIDPSVAL